MAVILLVQKGFKSDVTMAVILLVQKGFKSDVTMAVAECLYSRLNDVSGLRGEVLLDDRIQLTIGRRLTQAKSTGMPHVVALGKKV